MLTRKGRGARSQAEDLVLTTITQHADALLRTARRHSLCADDASDAYQRGLEIFLRNAGRLDAARAVGWLHTVIKHEAMAVRAARQRIVGAEEFDGDAVESLHTPAPDERLLAFEDVTRAAEALRGLKPQEMRALWLRMEGRTYKEIAAELDWSYTKVNRCVTEGRRAFLARYAGIESGEECRRYESALSAFVDGELAPAEIGGLRRHLRGCGGCRGTLRALRGGQRSLGAVLPVGFAVGGLDGGESVFAAIVRLYEAVAGHAQDRAMAIAAKTQVAVEATGVMKVAAVAGAAAVVAGGGAVTTADVERGPVAAQPVVQQAARQAPKAAVASAPVVVSAPAPGASSATRTTERRTMVRATHTRPAVEFGFEQAAAPTPRKTSPAPTPSRAGGEFDLEP
jgi:RNA polymerase sigma factor (sigma-70 family)